MVLVSEAALESAVSLLLQIEKTVAEGAGAAGLAAVLAHPNRFKGRKIGIPITGGTTRACSPTCAAARSRPLGPPRAGCG